MAGIKETMDVLNSIGDLADVFKKVMEDGKVGFGDIGQVFTAINIIKTAAEGAGEIPTELKDLSPEEVGELGKKAFEVVMKWLGVIVVKK